MKFDNLRADHFKELYLTSQAKNKELGEQRETLAEENGILRSELEQSIKKIFELRKAINTLEGELQQKNALLNEQSTIIKDVAKEIASFNKEFDKTLMQIEKKLKSIKTDTAIQGVAEEQSISSNKELVFGINIDANFIHSSSPDVLKYYLFTIGASDIVELELNEFKIEKKVDLVDIGYQFSDYLMKESQEMGYDIEGIVQVKPADIFHKAKLILWTNNKEFAIRIYEEFKEEREGISA